MRTLGDLLREHKRLTENGGVIEDLAPPEPPAERDATAIPSAFLAAAAEVPAHLACLRHDWQDRAPNPPESAEASTLRGALQEAVRLRTEVYTHRSWYWPALPELGIEGHTGESWSQFKLRATEAELRQALALVEELPPVGLPVVEFSA